MASRRHALGSAVSRYLSEMSEMSVRTVNAAAKVWVISFKSFERNVEEVGEEDMK